MLNDAIRSITSAQQIYEAANSLEPPATAKNYYGMALTLFTQGYIYKTYSKQLTTEFERDGSAATNVFKQASD